MTFPLRKKIRTILQNIIQHYAPPEIIPLIKHISSKGKYLSKNVSVVNRPPAGSILIIAPHPDDEAIGMGGVLGMLTGSRQQVTVLYLTDGRFEKTSEISKERVMRIRRQQTESIGDKYHIEQIFWDIKDASLQSNKVTVEKMIGILNDKKPDVVFLPSFFDHHYDHIASNQILSDTLKMISMPDLLLMGYEVWDNSPFPNYVIDISGYFEKKTDILSHYTLSLDEWDYIDMCRHRNALNYQLYVGSREGGYAEAFLSLDVKTYQSLYDDYVGSLEKFNMNLSRRIKNSKTPRCG